MVDKKILLEAINRLGIDGKPVCIHSSLKSFGYVDGGAETIIQAFLDAGCTVLVPTFTYMYEVYPPQNMRPKRNGTGDYSYFEKRQYDPPRIFTTESNDISREDMGTIPYTLLNMPSRKRGYNPLNSFAAIGDWAEDLVRNQSADRVYAPFEELCQRDGYVVLMGVNLDRATIIHYAEQVAGRKLFIRWAKNLQGETFPVSVGSCSGGFESFSDLLKPIEKTITVGNSHWRCFPAKEMVDICSNAIKAKPDITRCSVPDCERCNDTIAGGPVW